MQDDHNKVKPELKLVPKPEGYELRDRRSDKSTKACDWSVQDALYSVSQEVSTTEPVAILIQWYVKSQDGALIYRSRYAGDASQSRLNLLLEGLGNTMRWNK